MRTITHRDHDGVELESILITTELARRPSRAPDYAAENRALVALAREMATQPQNLPQKLVEMAVELCGAGTAGISLLEASPYGEYFSCQAMAGVYALHLGGGTSRHFSLCGTTLDRKAPQLFRYPARYFTYLAAIDTPIVESLVLPVSAGGPPLGTIWIMVHDEQQHFDAEAVRLMTDLAEFAGAALQVLSAQETKTQAKQARHEREDQPKALLRATLEEGVGLEWPADAALPIGEWPFRRLLEKLPAGAYSCDPQGLITYFNPHAVQLWGRAPTLNDPVDRFCGSFKLFSTDGSPITHDNCWMALALKTDQAYNGQEIIIERPDGERLTVLAHANPVHDESGILLGAVNVLVDISDHKRTEMALRESEARVKVALREKEVLLKEIHHRVKNNLQIISSLLDLQADALADPQLRGIFEESHQRIQAMALIHESLYQSRDLVHLSASDYLNRLSTQLCQAYDTLAARLTLTLKLEPIELEVNQAIPCGLILNELLSNIFKHAFPDDRAGAIDIALREEPAGHCQLMVDDTGIGFPEGVDFRATESLGLQLVCLLTEQLDGTITLGNRGGTHWTLTFPLAASAAQAGDAPCSDRP
jgi:two-component sensor histidine kinase